MAGSQSRSPNFAYAVPRPELAARVRRAVAQRRALEDPPPGLEGQLLQRRAFFASSLMHDQWGLRLPAYRGRSVELVVSEDLHLANPGAPLPDAVALDLGDGRGFAPVEIGTPVSATFADDTTAAQLTIRCTYGSEVLTAAFTVPLSDQPAAPEPDERWPLRGACGNTGTAYVYHAAGRTRVSRPVIMVEGFPGGHAADYLYDTFDQQGTATKLRAAGRDLVIVGLDQGADEIQRNADVLVACIRTALRHTEEPLVVGGVSMGGLVSRFALTAMEARDEPHRTETFLTIDTPHGGAYTSLGAQWFVQTCRSFLPALEAEAQLLDSPANQQFVMWWLHEGVAQTSPLRTALIGELAALGDYPQLPRRLAISCGRGDGVSEHLRRSANAELVRRTVDLGRAEDRRRHGLGDGRAGQLDPRRAAAAVAAPIRFHRPGVGGSAGWPGHYNGQVAALAAGVGCGEVTHAFDATCSVPTVSALDLRRTPRKRSRRPQRRAGPFDDYRFNSENQPHLTITRSVQRLAARGAGGRHWDSRGPARWLTDSIPIHVRSP